MDVPLLELVSAGWAFASALAVLVLGALCLVGGSSRPPGALAFGLFAIVWGVAIAAGHAMAFDLADPTLHLLYLALHLPLPFFLMEFVAAQPGLPGPPRAWSVVRSLAVALPASAALLLLLRPALLYEGSTVVGGFAHPAWGPLFVPLVVVPFTLAFALALLALSAARRRAPTPRLADRAAVLLVGLGLYAGFSAGNNLAFYGMSVLSGRGIPGDAGYAALFLVPAAVALHVVTAALRDARLARTRRDGRRDVTVALAVALPAAWGVVEGFLAHDVFPRLTTVGLWRLAGVAVLAYAVASWRTHDLPSRARSLAATSLGIAGAAALGASAYLLASPFLPLPAAVALGAGVPIAAASPGVHLARRALAPARAEAVGAEAGDGARLDTYRAALEASMLRGSLEEDAAFLGSLRERLGISRDVDAALRHYSRQSVLLAPADRSGWPFLRLSLLGEGGEGRTWLCRDLRRDAVVVVKEPSGRAPRLRESLRREARLALRIRHPNVVRVEEIAEGRDGPLVVMELVDGGSLETRLRSSGPMPADEAVRVLVDVLDGLSAIHAGGILHLDLKPSNVLLTRDGRAKVSDFGLARAFAPDADTTMTLRGTAGTLSAMAPEQVRGEAADARADVYGAGALLYRLLTGRTYVDLDGVGDFEARDRILHAAPRLPHPAVPERLGRVVAKALAKRPEERYATAAELRSAVLAAAPSAVAPRRS